jgi:1-acyl-sn-glycerol-3-phosphate acyltransferase
MNGLVIRDGARIPPGLRRIGRLVRVVAHIGRGLWLALRFDAFRQPHRALVREQALRWQQDLLEILGVRLSVSGKPAAGTVLHVSNHVSWLDIPVIGSLVPVHFLSKAEVRQWPLVGWLAQAAGTLFIRRGSGESGSKAQEIATHLLQRRTILVFPEGTTTDGTGVRRFFPALFRAAVAAGTPVQPLTLQYLDHRGHVDRSLAFVGDDRFHSHLWQLLLRDEIRVNIHFGALLMADDGDHRALALRAQREVAAAMAPAGIPHA